MSPFIIYMTKINNAKKHIGNQLDLNQIQNTRNKVNMEELISIIHIPPQQI